MVTGDGAYIKKINRSLILQKIIEHGFISRAELSKITGLNKATISVQVVDLLDEKLVYETQQEHNAVGRRPIMLSINGDAGYILGVDLDYHQVKFMISDLQGKIVHTDVISLHTENYDEVLNILIGYLKKYKKQYSSCHYGLVKTVIGIHGTVNNDESLRFVPTFKWSNRNIKSDIEKELDMDIAIENNANLSAFAERVYKHHHCSNLLTLVLTSGIGAGIMINGKLHKGYHGYAGEMGHMIIVPDGKPCSCGNDGCWELYASEPTLFSSLSDQLNKPKLNYRELAQLLHENDPIVFDEMKAFTKSLSIGLNNIINIYNPDTLVLNSELLNMYPHAINEIESNLNSSVSDYQKIVISELGSDATVKGACAFGIQKFLEVEEVVFNHI